MKDTVLITGGAKGIGRAMAEIFARQGYPVVCNYFQSRNEALELEERLLGEGFTIAAVQGDISHKEDVDNMFAIAEKKFGPVGILINNAGISQFRMFTEITNEDWETMLRVNLTGMFHCTQRAVPEMIRAKRGRIINIASIWGMVGASCEVHYSTVKAGIIGFSKSLAKELGPSNIQVNCIAPGIIETDMLQNLTGADKKALAEETPLMRLGKPEDIASLALYLSSPEAAFITGQVISPNGGFVI